MKDYEYEISFANSPRVHKRMDDTTVVGFRLGALDIHG